MGPTILILTQEKARSIIPKSEDDFVERANKWEGKIRWERE